MWKSTPKAYNSVCKPVLQNGGASGEVFSGLSQLPLLVGIDEHRADVREDGSLVPVRRDAAMWWNEPNWRIRARDQTPDINVFFGQHLHQMGDSPRASRTATQGEPYSALQPALRQDAGPICEHITGNLDLPEGTPTCATSPSGTICGPHKSGQATMGFNPLKMLGQEPKIPPPPPPPNPATYASSSVQAAGNQATTQAAAAAGAGMDPTLAPSAPSSTGTAKANLGG